MKQYNWGIIGLGNIAREFASNIVQLHPVYAVASRNLDSALAFQAEYQAEKAYGSYEELLSDPAVDIVYIATVNSQHYKWIMESLAHGKHVLCEKTIWGNYEEMKTAYALAEEKGLLLCEAMTIYHMPLFKEIKKMIAEGQLGKIKFSIQNPGFCNFLYRTHNTFSTNHIAISTRNPLQNFFCFGTCHIKFCIFHNPILHPFSSS